MDRNRNKSLDPVEFKYAMRDYGLELVGIYLTLMTFETMIYLV